MSTLSVFGAQWGDEGKGKMIDLLARDVDVVVRYQGGANAGHTVHVGDEKYVLHLIPSGMLHGKSVNVIGCGVTIDPEKLLQEIHGLRDRGIGVDPNNLRISANAHVIFEYHKRIDGLAERWKGDGRIGTTGRGIGPSYADKTARTGIRMSDLIDPERLHQRLNAALREKNAIIQDVYGEEPFEFEALYSRYRDLGAELAPFVGDTGREIRDAHAAGKRVLFEGAQGLMLDLDAGTYPYVTSSNTGTAGIGSGASFPPQKVERAFGIAKAYCTRVGEGPFPSEQNGEIGETIRAAGNEYGATTGRPRRCGWLDAVALRHALELSGADGWVMTNLDVLSGFGEIGVGTSYRCNGETFERFPAHLPDFDPVEVGVEMRAGWSEDITGVRKFEDLPESCREYVEWVEETVGSPIVMLSVGPDREQVIPRGEFWQ